MIIEVIFAVVPILITFSCLYLIWPAFSKKFAALLMTTMSLAIGIGLGIASCNFFLWLTCFGKPTFYIFYTELILYFTIFFISYFINRYTDSAVVSNLNFHTRNSQYLWVLFYTAIFISALLFILLSLKSPHGEWDAWAIWNLRARFIFRGSEYWHSAFSQYMDWSHPDYPLFLPITISRIWTFSKAESVFVPNMIAFLFTFGTIGLLVSAVSYFRGSFQALLSGVFLMSIYTYIRIGASQFADIPLSFFILSTLILLACFHLGANEKKIHFLFLSGLTSGLAAWTKNEGILFILCVIISHLIFMRQEYWKYSFKNLVAFFSGAIPIIAVVLYFKLRFSPSTDIFFENSYQSILHKILDPSRYVTVLKAYASDIYKLFGLKSLFIIGMIAACGISKNRQLKFVAFLLSSILFLQLMGYFFIYIITPHDINWHLRSSLNRLLVQLLPGFIFIIFLMLETTDIVYFKSLRKYFIRT